MGTTVCTSIKSTVDLVITHGRNNTVTESFYFGKPMIVMPFFGDQTDNAQRIDEKWFGIRLDSRRCSKQELLESIETLLKDKELNTLLSDLDNCKWSGPDFCRFAIKKFAIIKKFFHSIIILFKILVKFSCQSSSDVFYFIKTYLINQNIIKLNLNLTLPYYIFKLSPIPTLIQKKKK